MTRPIPARKEQPTITSPRWVSAGCRALLAGALALAFCAAAGAQEMRAFQHDAGVTAIPVHPQRIVALNDIQITIPMIELGVFPVGSMGRVAPDGTPYLRASMALTGVDFSNSDLVWVGTNGEPDVEAIAALRPDLIINNQDAPVNAQLSQIAPTIVLFPLDATSGVTHLKMVADAVGALDRFERLEARLDWQLAEARRIIPDASEITVSLLYAYDGQILALYHPRWGSIGYVLSEIGFGLPAVFADPSVLDPGESILTLSAERLQDVDADFIIDSYNASNGLAPDDARAAMAAVLPDWCPFLHACRNNQYIAIPRDEAYAYSFRSFDLMIQTVVTAIGGRDFVPLPR